MAVILVTINGLRIAHSGGMEGTRSELIANQALAESASGPPLGWDLTLPVIRWNLIDAAFEWGRMAAAA